MKIDGPAGSLAQELRKPNSGRTAVKPAHANPLMSRQLALFRVRAEAGIRAKVIEIASVFRGRVVDACPASLTIEATGIPDEIAALEELLADFGALEVVCTNPISLDS